MSSSTDIPETPHESLSQASSELNNLLQIISGTSVLLEDDSSKESRDNYMSMLRTSIARAEKVAGDVAHHAGITSHKKLTNPSQAGANPGQGSTSAASGKRTIVIVDDDEMVLTLVKQILTEAGFEVETASSGFQCLDIVRKQPHLCDLVLLDLTMPFMDGEDTFKRLREIRADLPVILCTGFIQQERLTRLMSAGLSGFLRKPIAPDEIVSFVRSTLASVKYTRGNFDAIGASLAS